MRKLPYLLPLLLLFILVLLTSCSSTQPDNLHEATFVRVVDGDTLIANIDGKEEYVRLILVDTLRQNIRNSQFNLLVLKQVHSWNIHTNHQTPFSSNMVRKNGTSMIEYSRMYIPKMGRCSISYY